MKEDCVIKAVRYRDDENNPTCACNFNNGEFCKYYRTMTFGTKETCLFAEDKYNGTELLLRRDEGRGSLIPLENCPLWKE